jgi:hypothetical protein
MRKHEGHAPTDNDPCGWANVAECRAIEELRDAADAIENAEQAQRDLVAIYRSQGVPWSTIGDAYGITKQAAQQRFGA